MPEAYWREQSIFAVQGFIVVSVLLFGLEPCAAMWRRVFHTLLGPHDSTAVDVAIAIFTMGTLVSAVVLPFRLVEIWIARRQRRRLARHDHLCAACEYDLTGLAMEADGCTVCPECGAAWRVGEAEGQSDERAG